MVAGGRVCCSPAPRECNEMSERDTYLLRGGAAPLQCRLRSGRRVRLCLWPARQRAGISLIRRSSRRFIGLVDFDRAIPERRVAARWRRKSKRHKTRHSRGSCRRASASSSTSGRSALTACPLAFVFLRETRSRRRSKARLVGIIIATSRPNRRSASRPARPGGLSFRESGDLHITTSPPRAARRPAGRRNAGRPSGMMFEFIAARSPSAPRRQALLRTIERAASIASIKVRPALAPAQISLKLYWIAWRAALSAASSSSPVCRSATFKMTAARSIAHWSKWRAMIAPATLPRAGASLMSLEDGPATRFGVTGSRACVQCAGSRRSYRC